MISTVGGRQALSIVLTIPAWGVWFLEAILSGENALTGALACSVADLALFGTALHSGSFNGRTAVRVVGGRGGLAKVIPAHAYHDDAGVRISTVIRDAMREAGETLDESTLPTTRLGPHYTRPEATAASVLERHARGAWYVAEDGTVRLGARPAAVLPPGVAIEAVDKARGVLNVASSTIATLLPGLTAEGLVVTDVRHEANGDTGLRTTLWGRARPGATTRRLDSWRRLLEGLDPDRKFRGVVEYRVVTVQGSRLNLQPVRSGLGMPELRRVPAWPGVPGCEGDVVPGSRVLVGFVDSDPSRPYVAAYEGSEGLGFVPTELRLARGVAGVARAGDPVEITAAQLSAAGATAGGFPLTLATSILASIKSGSTKVKCG